MNRRVQRQHLDTWLDEHFPNAVTKLSVKSGVAANTISKIRLGRVPKNHDVREQLATALGVTQEQLFPTAVEIAPLEHRS